MQERLQAFSAGESSQVKGEYTAIFKPSSSALIDEMLASGILGWSLPFTDIAKHSYAYIQFR